MEKILQRVYANKKLAKGLRLVSHAAGIYAFILFFFVCLGALLNSPVSALKLCVIIGTSYIIVSLFRNFINAPRPYELYEFYEAPPKEKQGHSFPSRHTFLIFALATVSFPASPIASSVLFLLGVLLALSRVLLGIHFIRDVLGGALLGTLSSLIGLLILMPY